VGFWIKFRSYIKLDSRRQDEWLRQNLRGRSRI